VKIFAEVAKVDRTSPEVFRAHGVSQNTFYLWERKYADAQSDDLKRLQDLKLENTQLKRIVEETTLENEAVKGVVGKTWMVLPSDVWERNN